MGKVIEILKNKIIITDLVKSELDFTFNPVTGKHYVLQADNHLAKISLDLNVDNLKNEFEEFALKGKKLKVTIEITDLEK